MPFTDKEIDALNTEEKARPPEFFQAFAQQVTVYEDDDIWVVDKPAGLLSVNGKTLKIDLIFFIAHHVHQQRNQIFCQ